MLSSETTADGIRRYISPLLREAGVAHAFSTRIGGISAAPFDSMNLGNPNGCAVQDEPGNIWENYRMLQAAIDCEPRELCRVHQVHGTVVARAEVGRPFDVSFKADAIVSDDPARVLSVRVADCVPVLLSTEDGRKVAAVHAGWRGVVAGIVPAAVAALGGGEQLIAAIGPCIGMDAFEVGPEVLAEFSRLFGAAAPLRPDGRGKGHVDLRRAIAMQLNAVGVSADRIDMTDRCTHRDADEFFSHRREKGVTGRMAALIAPRARVSATP